MKSRLNLYVGIFVLLLIITLIKPITLDDAILESERLTLSDAVEMIKKGDINSAKDLLKGTFGDKDGLQKYYNIILQPYQQEVLIKANNLVNDIRTSRDKADAEIKLKELEKLKEDTHGRLREIESEAGAILTDEQKKIIGDIKDNIDKEIIRGNEELKNVEKKTQPEPDPHVDPGSDNAAKYITEAKQHISNAETSITTVENNPTFTNPIKKIMLTNAVTELNLASDLIQKTKNEEKDKLSDAQNSEIGGLVDKIKELKKKIDKLSRNNKIKPDIKVKDPPKVPGKGILDVPKKGLWWVLKKTWIWVLIIIAVILLAGMVARPARFVGRTAAAGYGFLHLGSVVRLIGKAGSGLGKPFAWAGRGIGRGARGSWRWIRGRGGGSSGI